MLKYDASQLVSEFLDLVNDGGVVEADLQRFMEQHSEFIPTLLLLGHDVEWNSVLSKFELDRDKVPDFAYLTKNSAFWQLVLIELERPQKRLFIETPHPDFHSDTRAAIAQIDEWKSFVEANLAEVRRRLGGLMPLQMRDNPIEVKYILVVGRNSDISYPPQHNRRIHRLFAEQHICLLTYDSIARMAQADRLPCRRNVLSHHRSGFRMKSAQSEETSLFSYLGPNELILNDDAKNWFAERGFDMEAWSRGELLRINHRLPWSRREELFGGLSS